jgi:raffinose/stachyose/melibiose transport system permease protein
MQTRVLNRRAGGSSGNAPTGVSEAPPGPRRRARSGRSWVSWWFLVPGLFLYVLIVLYPSVRGAIFAFTDWSGLGDEYAFTGLSNFRRFADDPQATSALRNSVLIAAGIVVVQNLVGLLLALGVQSNLKSKGLLRLLFFLPTTIATVVVSILWSYLYTSSGPINSVLHAVGLSPLTRTWVGDPDTVLPALVLVVVWQFAGFSMVIFLAGLEGVPRELWEAVAIDGAGPWQKLRLVTLPLIAPALTINLMLSLIGGLKLFDQIFVITGGGPGYASETLSTVLYKQAFQFARFGYGTAIALLLALFVVVAAIVQLSLLRRFGEQG